MDEQVRIAGEVARAVVGAADRRCRGRVRRAAAHDAHGARIRRRRGRRHPYRGPALPEARALSHISAHAVPLAEFVAKINYACRQRDETDPDFVIIARTDTCRANSVSTRPCCASTRRPRSAPISVSSSRATTTRPRRRRTSPCAARSGCRAAATAMAARSFRSTICSEWAIAAASTRSSCSASRVHFMKQALAECSRPAVTPGSATTSSSPLRKDIEDLIGLDAYYRIEAETVEPGSRPR